MNTIGDYQIPKHVISQNTLEILTENQENAHKTTENQTSKFDFYIKTGNVIFTIGT